MAHLDELYRTVVLDHGKAPRNVGRLPAATHGAEGDNPLCGDHVRLDLTVAGTRVADARFEATGCVIVTASASLLTEHVRGRTRAEALALAARVARACAHEPADGERTDLGDLAALGGVRRFPLRARCALLPWHALADALGAPPPDTARFETRPGPR